MKLLYTLTTYPPAIGGAQLHQHLLAQQLRPHHEVSVLNFWSNNRTDWLLGTTLKAHTAPHSYTIDGIPVHRIGFTLQEKLKMLPWLPLYYPLMSVALPPIASIIATHLRPLAQSADLIHNVRIGREGLTYASWQTARQRDIPFILTPVHHPRWVGWRYREYTKLYRQADAVIALTPSEKTILTDLGVQPDRIHVTGIGPVLSDQADGLSFRQRHGISGAMVLFLGQHYAYKGHQAVLDAAPLVWQKLPDVHFAFVGPPVKDSEKSFQATTDPRVHRLGSVSLQEKTDAIASCDLLCVPSMQESFGGVYTEAWSFEKPVIGGKIPAIMDVIQDGVDGYVVNQKASEIAEKICHVLLHPVQAETLGRAGKQKVLKNYTWEQLGKKTKQIYLRTLSAS